MLLVDQIISETDQELVAEKTFHSDEFFFQGHYPDHPLVPGVILCECAAQVGALYLSGKMAGVSGIPVLTRMNDVRFKRMVRPGETIRTTVKLEEKLADAWFLQAVVRVGTEVAVRLQFACTVTAND
jgi:3-hydroxyacyl-[acyl-carrier-protein] dehydratase